MSVVFRAMCTDIAVDAPTLDEPAEAILVVAIFDLFEQSERVFSRFRPERELSRLNRAHGPRPVSDVLFAVLRTAHRYAAQTAGVFDPAVGAALVAAGYDRSFAPGALDRAAPASLAPRRASVLDLRFDSASRTVDRPEGALLDLGGIVKGWTVDRAAALLPDVAALDAGGDAVLRGGGPDGAGWIVDVEDPRDSSQAAISFRVCDRAVATSAANRRRWRMGTAEQHHLIDPRTGRPAVTDLLQVTVVAPSAELAEVLAKAAFILGAHEGARLLGRFDGVDGVLVLDSGALELVGDLEVIHEA